MVRSALVAAALATAAAREEPTQPGFRAAAGDAGVVATTNVLCDLPELTLPVVEKGGLASDEVAIFLLSNAAVYCGRSLPMINTWGRAFPHVYSVFANTSAPGAEGAYRFGKPEGDYRGLRSYARELMRRLYDECNETDAAPGLWNVRRCGDAGVREIVVAGTCTNPTHRGASGPCCRANSAMRLFVDRATTTFAKVKWFFFSDDDVYFRSRALLGLLARRDPADPAAALAAAPTGRGIVNYCRGPAEHYLAGKPWHVVSGLSRAALVERVAAGVRRNAAGAQCDALKMVGHDVGLGFFAWMYALDVAMLAPLPVTRRDKARPGPPMFNYAAIFNPERNFSADQIAAETKSTGDFTAVRREIARFHFFHCGPMLCRGAYDMFRYLRSLGDDEAGDDFVFPDPPVYHHRGFACTAYARRHDVSAASAEPWVPFNATDCEAPLVGDCDPPPPHHHAH